MCSGSMGLLYIRLATRWLRTREAAQQLGLAILDATSAYVRPTLSLSPTNNNAMPVQLQSTLIG